ncbi:MAG: hypothetical protein LPJ89_06400 [Hymenobacteraceae bacterium]|nr:hypothetical protein [Hymenobacteraceae bacterium]MDX5396078.1 hypothetical protein [Hymenobacteraceae bacterium]MDX5443401.1 hypothetical protein [Hymenobacteraceae bacterium]MDX5512143.1 hypothetical protein [Hymenobacteraceae bacterium]
MKTLSTILTITMFIWCGKTTFSNQSATDGSKPAIQLKKSQSEKVMLATAEADMEGTSIRYFRLEDGSISGFLPVIEIKPESSSL